MNITGSFLTSRFEDDFNMMWNRTGAFSFQNLTLDSGYATIKSGSSSTTMTKNFFDASMNWTGINIYTT